ncbi:MAG: nitroreductase family protein [Planctomycetota bacterium]|nr:nitroreductase family protein [Planctomycetota bacterium]
MPTRSRKTPKARKPALDGQAFQDLARSVMRLRRLEPGKIAPAQLDRILECARHTPSVAGRQPWLLATCNGDSARGLMVDLAGNAAFEDFFSASQGENIVRDLQAAGAMILIMGERNEPFWRESCMVLTHQLLMAASAEQLAARAIMPRSPNDLAMKIRVPDEYLAFMLVLIGHPGAPEPERTHPKPIADVAIPLKGGAQG